MTYNSKTISCSNVFHTSNTCNFCGTNQNTPTVFSGLIKTSSYNNEEEFPAELSMIGICVCECCFELFDNDYNKLIRSYTLSYEK